MSTGINYCVFVLTFLMFSSEVSASPASLNYQGRILKSNGDPLEYNNVSFLFQITDPGGGCILYEEQVDGYSMENSKGLFDRSIGTGTRSFPASGTFNILDSFSNLSVLACKGGSSYTPLLDDVRRLRVRFHDGTGWNLLTPDSTIRSVPYAGQAASANKFAGHGLNEFLLRTGIPICDSDEQLLWSGTSFSCVALPTGGGGAGSVTEVFVNSPLTILNGTTTPTISLPKADATHSGYLSSADWNVFNGKLSSSTSLNGDVSGTYGATSVDKIKGSDVTITSLTSGNFLKYAGSSWVNSNIAISDIANLSTQLGNKLDAASMPATCGVSQTLTFSSPSGTWVCSNILISGSAFASNTQNLVFASPDGLSGTPSFRALTLNDLPASLSASAWSASAGHVYRATGGVGIGTSTPQSLLQVTGGVQIGMDNASCAAGKEGTLRYNAGNVEYCNGASWEAFGVNGAGITAINGSTAASHSFAIPNQNGLAPGWSTNAATGVHTLSIPLASTLSVTAGLISNADYAAFSAKLGAASSFIGDVSGTAGATSVDKIKGTSVSVTAPTTAGEFLVYNGTAQYAPVVMNGDATMAANGAVTLKNTGTTGTYFRVTTDAQGRVVSGNSSLSSSDIPSLDWTKITSGTPNSLSGYGITDAIHNAGGVISIQSGLDAAKGVASVDGRIYIATDTQKIYRDNGTSLVVVASVDAVGGGGTVTNVSASGPISVLNGTTTPAISIAQATTSTDGYVTQADWNSFNSKLSAVTNAAPLTNAKIWIGDSGGVAQEQSVSGEVSLTAGGVTRVAGLQGRAVSAVAAASGTFLKYDGTSWSGTALGISDITNLSTQLGNKLDAGNMPANCAANQTLTFSSPTGAWNCSSILITGSAFSSQGANLILASPNGSTGTPIFRGLARADLPADVKDGLWTESSGHVYRATGNVGVGVANPQASLHVAGAGNGIVMIESLNANGGNAELHMVSKNNVGTALNSYIRTDDFGNFEARSNSGQYDFKNSSNSTSLFVSTAGNVGVGTASPGQALEVNGSIRVGSQLTRATTTGRGQLALGSTMTQTQASAVTVDWNRGNLQEVASFLCNGSNLITMSNLKDGAVYTLLLSGAAAHSSLCMFSAAGFTFKTSGGNIPPAASRDVLFTFAVIGTTVVYTMMDNLQ